VFKKLDNIWAWNYTSRYKLAKDDFFLFACSFCVSCTLVSVGEPWHADDDVCVGLRWKKTLHVFSRTPAMPKNAK
jgi:hypothetical protein